MTIPGRLFRGHLVLDIDIPSMLLDQCPEKTETEFSKMRYTAVTCDPNDFVDDKYTLRQRLYDPPRQTELFIVCALLSLRFLDKADQLLGDHNVQCACSSSIPFLTHQASMRNPFSKTENLLLIIIAGR